ncbi:DNA topoisomerase, partial [Baffinella frigidus]
MSHNRVLCVAEKPTVAKSIANILYRPQTAQSLRTHSIYNPKYEFQCFFEGRNVTMVVTSVTGHLMESDFDDRHRKWHSCDPRALMDLSTPVCRRVPQDKSPLKDTLEEEARKCGTLVCCLDGDREGENISYEVIEVCRGVNARMILKRARFSACINQEIDRAFASLQFPDENLSHAVDARSEIDLRLGAAFTRFQTLHLGKKFEQTTNLVLSWGPCQFATLGFIVDRAWKIESHVVEHFYSVLLSVARDGKSCAFNWKRVPVLLSVARDGKSCAFNWKRGNIFDHTMCVALFDAMLDANSATVMNVSETEKKRWRPIPLDTEELQVQASRKLHISSEETMQIAEDLYTKGLISYPR